MTLAIVDELLRNRFLVKVHRSDSEDQIVLVTFYHNIAAQNNQLGLIFDKGVNCSPVVSPITLNPMVFIGRAAGPHI
mgnify:CR=1 FL=1